MRDRIFLSGVTIGPAVGHFYATTYWKGALFSASLRLGLCLATPYFFREFVYKPWNGDGSAEKFIAGYFLCLTTILATAASTCGDIILVPDAIRKYNRSHNFVNRLQFMPIVDVKNGGYKFLLSYNF